MDTTQIDELLQALEQAEPSRAPDLVDEVAAALEEALDEGAEGSTS
jgi:hypothetical protein